jgi:DNA-binding beta-propeller fold protein YncE
MRPIPHHLASLVAFLLAAAVAPAILAKDLPGKDLPGPSFANRHKVPPLPQGLTWLNSSGPIELSDLRGKFVLMDFWTYCCINCMHILPELDKLEHAYPKNLVVIGVHSAKFNTERDSTNIAQAIGRYKIEHPVINDSQHAVWELFGVNVWPTLILIDPEGYAIWGTTGEVTFDQVDRVMKKAVAYYRKKNLLDETPLKFNASQKAAQDTPLRYPGKVLADAAGDRLFIADSNHNRIVIARLDGTLIDVVGSGQAGMKDGAYATASFKQPQGMALLYESRQRGEGIRQKAEDSEQRAEDSAQKARPLPTAYRPLPTLFVADTENHAIRRIDLTARTVTTVAGTGEQAREAPSMIRHADGRHTALSSPWDLAIQGNFLYIAMAGCHQIWRMRTDGAAVGPYAGNAREDIIDGPLLPAQAYELGASSFAQPSGLASDGAWLYVADSEGSSIRVVPMAGTKARGDVRTLVGTSMLPSARLFTFGDVDGPAPQVRLQHPLGLAYAGNKLYVADTYNHKIKVIDIATGTTITLGTEVVRGRGGEVQPDLRSLNSSPPQPLATSQPTSFREPGGLSIAAGKLYVADTNNHRICVIDDLTGGLVATLPITGLKPPAHIEEAADDSESEAEKLPLTIVHGKGQSVRLRIQIDLPVGFHMNPLAPLSYQIDAAASSGAAGLVDRRSLKQRVTVEKPSGNFDIRLPLQGTAGSDTLLVRVEFFYCREGAGGVCKAGSAVWKVPIQVDPAATGDMVVLHCRAR